MSVLYVYININRKPGTVKMIKVERKRGTPTLLTSIDIAGAKRAL